MKRYFFFVIVAVLLAYVLPLSVFGVVGLKNGKKVSHGKGEMVSVYFHTENKIKNLDMEDYLYNVVAAEMPATFEMEALKAQAVAARSYTVYKKENPSEGHMGANVCTDYTHCKAYKTDDELTGQWKTSAKEYEKKIRNAVNETRGETITYNGEAALAVFHSQSGNGRTESSKDVWGGDVPYLTSVESIGEEDAPDYYTTQKITFQEFKEKISGFNSEAKITSPESIGEAEISDGKSVKSINIGGAKISGKDIRTLFNLRSTCFEITADDNFVTFNVRGYGHGVGMSQYGANAMAKAGADYREILSHYYKGTELVFN